MERMVNGLVRWLCTRVSKMSQMGMNNGKWKTQTIMLNDTPKCRGVVFKTKKMISLRLGVFVRDMVPQWRDGSAQQCPRCPEWG